MRIVVEMELEFTAKDTENLDRAVLDFFNKARGIPFGIFRQNLSITRIRKVEPWESSAPKLDL